MRRRRRAVVTGGSGFLGSWLCELLLAEGWGVVCVDNFLTGHADNVAHLVEVSGFRLMESDVCEDWDVREPVDLVLHLASAASPVSYLRHPVATMRAGSHGTLNALELARRHSARFLLASTSEVYGDPLEHPQRESYWGNVNPIGPRSVYDESKRFAEALTYSYRRQRIVDARAVRIFNTYGPRMAVDDGRVVPTFLAQALTGRPITVAGDGRQTRSLCFVTDTTRGLLAAALSDHAGPFNIGNDHELTMLELAETVQAVCGSSSAIVHTRAAQDDPRVRRPDLSRTADQLAWQPRVPLHEGLRRTVDWLRVSGRLETADPDPVAMTAPVPQQADPAGATT
jgi:dTDP-glucose 4,6-dehydratase